MYELQDFSIGQRTWTHNLGNFCRGQEPRPHPHKHNKVLLCQFQEEALNTLRMGHSLIVFHLVMWCEVMDSWIQGCSSQTCQPIHPPKLFGLNRKTSNSTLEMVGSSSKSFPIKVWEIPFPSIYLQLMSLLFHLLKSKLPNNFEDGFKIVSHLSGAILWRGLGDSISKHLPPTSVITFPLVKIKASTSQLLDGWLTQ